MIPKDSLYVTKYQQNLLSIVCVNNTASENNQPSTNIKMQELINSKSLNILNYFCLTIKPLIILMVSQLLYLNSSTQV